MVTEAGGAHGERSCALRSECHRGDFAGPQIFHRDIAVWVSALEEFSGRYRHGFDVAIGARLAINQDFELRAWWVFLHCEWPMALMLSCAS